MALGLKYLKAIEQGAASRSSSRRSRPELERCSTASRAVPVRRPRSGPGRLRRARHALTGPTSPARRVRARAGPRRRRPRDADPRHVPRHAGPQRGARRHAAPAPSRRRRRPGRPPPDRAGAPPRTGSGSSGQPAAGSSVARDAKVNSFHHQGVAGLGTLVVTGRAGDGTVEGSRRATATSWSASSGTPSASSSGRAGGAVRGVVEAAAQRRAGAARRAWPEPACAASPASWPSAGRPTARRRADGRDDGDRGPDGAGMVAGQVALAHRRLKIIDLSAPATSRWSTPSSG